MGEQKRFRMQCTQSDSFGSCTNNAPHLPVPAIVDCVVVVSVMVVVDGVVVVESVMVRVGVRF